MFRHPNFHTNGKDELDNIKRKTTGNRTGPPQSPAVGSPSGSLVYMEMQLERMSQQQEEIMTHIVNVRRDYETLVADLATLQANMSRQEAMVQQLMQYVMRLEGSGRGPVPGQQYPSVPN